VQTNNSRRTTASAHALTVSMFVLAAVSARAENAAPATGAAAQEPLEEVTVTGYRNSLARAIDIKRQDNQQVDAILAEDIGKFPDLNLSESIQRIPGVALARDAGEGREISVRGLGPQFTMVRLNGMEALTTTGSSDAAGGVNRGRSFDFNVFSSDLFNQIAVRKTAEAATEEGSLGATVDLRTARPFDYNGFKFVVSGQGSYNDLAEKVEPRAAALISDTNADGTLGALLSLAYTKRTLEDDGTSTVRWATGSAFAPGFQAAPAGLTLAQLNAAFHPRFPRFDQYFDDQKRLGGSGSVQWRPTDHTSFTLDALYADFKGTRQEQYLEAPSFSVGGACTTANRPTSCGIAQTAATAATIDSQNVLVAGTFNNVDLRVEDRLDHLDTTFTQFSLDGEHRATEHVRIHGLVGHSKSDFENPMQTTLTLDQYNVQGYGYDYTVGRVPLLNYGSANLTSPTSWVLTQIRERPQSALNTHDTAQTDLTFEASEKFKVTAGLDWKRYTFDTSELRRSNGTTTNQEATIPAGIASIPLSSYTQVTNFDGRGLSLPAGSAMAWLVPNLGTAAGIMSLYDQTAFNGAFHLGPEPALGNNRSVEERDSGGYLQADFTSSLLGRTLRGDLGLRLVRTQQSASGYTFVSGAPVPISVDRSYQDTLPSLNLVWLLAEDFQLRGAAARVMARPDLGSLSPGATLNVSGANRSVTAGNPNLDPFRANAFDLAFEWYPARGTLVSLALFRKNVSSFVQTLTTTGTFTGNPFGLPDSVAVAACGNVVGCSPSANWSFSVPRNTSGGSLTGFEINYQQPFAFLPGVLRHTGALLNFTSVRSSIDYLNAAGVVVATNDLTGLSRRSYNATLYYEDSRWSARVSAAYRSRYLTRVPGQEAGTDFDGTNATLNVDTSIQFSVNDHFKLTFEGINLTDEVQDQFNDSANLVSFYHHTGREFMGGFRYSF
jgi:TonB-dependent receptor